MQAGCFATAAGSAFALAGGAEAAIIYSGAQNLQVSVTSILGSYSSSIRSIGLDVDGGSGSDLLFRLQFFVPTGSSSQGSAVATVTGGGSSSVVPALNSQQPSNALHLSSGATVGISNSFPGTNTNQWFLNGRVSSTSSSQTYGTFSGSDTAFVGFQLLRPDGVHYGWVRLILHDTDSPTGSGPDGVSDSIDIVDWAWEDTPDQAITVGDVPEPSGISMLAAGATSLALWRRRRARAAASVHTEG